MSMKLTKVCRTFNCIELLLTLISTVTRCASISTFVSQAGILIGIMSSATGLKICVITAGIKKYKLIIEKKMRKHDKIVLLAKSALITMEFLTSKTLVFLNFFQYIICWKNFMIWKKKLKVPMLNKNANYM